MFHELGMNRRAFAATVAGSLKKVAKKKEPPKEEATELTASDFIQKGAAFAGVICDSCPRDPDEWLRPR